MLKLTLILPTGAELLKLYEVANHYTVENNAPHGVILRVYQQGPAETRDSALRKGLVADVEYYELTEEQRAMFKPSGFIAVVYIAASSSFQITQCDDEPADETFAIWSADRKMWFNRKAKTPAEREHTLEFTVKVPVDNAVAEPVPGSSKPGTIRIIKRADAE